MSAVRKKTSLFIASLLLLVMISILCFLAGRSFWVSWRDEVERATATAIVEQELTEEYGNEVSRAIENFVLQWHTLETITDTESMSKIATYPFLDMYGMARQQMASNDPNINWPVVKTVEVQWLRVIEYTPQRFKAVARTYRVVDKVTLDNEITETNVELPPSCGIYVFVYEDDTWKLSASFLTSNATIDELERDWHYADSVTKETIGELPGGPLCKPWP